MEQEIVRWGSIASAVAAMVGLAAKIITAAVKRTRKARAEREEFQRRVLGSLDAINTNIQNLSEDIADLQCDRLNEAHDHYMRIGYCPTEIKQGLVKMYKSYHSKGRNTLAVHYEEDLLELPADADIERSETT